MKVTIRPMDEENLANVHECKEAFLIDSQLVLEEEKGEIRYSITSISPYEKRYPLKEKDYAAYINNPDKAVFFAYVDGELAGHIRLLKHWNAYGYVDDIAVKARFRGHGVGRALILHAIEWAREKDLPGLMLETQNNNVAACRLYESCGFHLGGFDRYLYKGLDPDTEEIALYWYLMLR